jgi:hypothetical protein
MYCAAQEDQSTPISKQTPQSIAEQMIQWPSATNSNGNSAVHHIQPLA